MAFTDGDAPPERNRIRLGIYPSPVASDPDHLAELAVIAEDAGLDLVVVQDHPYQPAFLDALAVSAVVAERTSRIEVIPHVAALPLRLPAVLAKGVASLDLLSAGRSGLALSAGEFADGIVAAGGPSLSGPDAAAALGEAADVIRATWSGSGVVSVDGTHHRVEGLVSGPRPAHRTPLWMTARTPEEIAVAAAKADLWLGSIATCAPFALGAEIERLEAAAAAAGRTEPLERGYLAAVSDGFLDGDDWESELSHLVAAHGISVILLATDDPDEVELLGEVAAAVRAAEAAPAAALPATAPLRVEPTPMPTEQLSDRGLPTDRPHVEPTPDAWYLPAQQVAPADLVARHDALRAELARVHDLVDQVSQGVIDVAQARNLVNKMTMRTTAWNLGGYCQGYCRLVSNHHVDEDTTMFPHLRAAEASLGPVLDRLEEEHAVIASVLEDLDTALVAVVAGQVTDLGAVRRELAVLTDVLLSHLSYEEAELLHPLARHGAGS